MRRSLGGVRVLMRSNFDMKWFQIAVEHERAAIDARKRAEAAEAGSNEMSTAFGDELRAAMVVIAATAFSIDALYVKIDDLLDSAERIRGKRRVASIVETFKIALDLGGRGQAWQKDIPALFSRRDKLVHFRGELTEPGPHPNWEVQRICGEPRLHG